MVEQIVTWDVGCGQRNTMCAKKEYMHELEISHSFIH